MLKNLIRSIPIFISIAIIRDIMWFSYWWLQYYSVMIIYFLLMVAFCFFIGWKFLVDAGSKAKNFLSVLPLSIFVAIAGIIILNFYEAAYAAMWVYYINPFYELFEMVPSILISVFDRQDVLTSNSQVIGKSIVFFVTEMLVPLLLILGIQFKKKQAVKEIE